MWHGHPFSQRNKTSKVSGGWRLEATDKGVGQNFKKVGGQYRGVFITQGVLGTLCQLWPIRAVLEKRCSDSLGKLLETTCEGVHF